MQCYRIAMFLHNCHYLCPFALLVFLPKDPFLAGAKVASIKPSSSPNFPCSNAIFASAKRIFSKCLFFSPILQPSVASLIGRKTFRQKLHRAPLRNFQRMPSRMERGEWAGGRPWPRGPFGVAGNNGSINSHCSSVSFIPHIKPSIPNLSRQILKLTHFDYGMTSTKTIIFIIIKLFDNL